MEKTGILILLDMFCKHDDIPLKLDDLLDGLNSTGIYLEYLR